MGFYASAAACLFEDSARLRSLRPSHCLLRHRCAITRIQRAPPTTPVRGWTGLSEATAACSVKPRLYASDGQFADKDGGHSAAYRAVLLLAAGPLAVVDDAVRCHGYYVRQGLGTVAYHIDVFQWLGEPAVFDEPAALYVESEVSGS